MSIKMFIYSKSTYVGDFVIVIDLENCLGKYVQVKFDTRGVSPKENSILTDLSKGYFALSVKSLQIGQCFLDSHSSTHSA